MAALSTTLLAIPQRAAAALTDLFDETDHFTSLPAELITEIFSRLNGQDIRHFELVCRRFYAISHARFSHGHFCVAYHAIGAIVHPLLKQLVLVAEKKIFIIPYDEELTAHFILIEHTLRFTRAESTFFHDQMSMFYPQFQKAVLSKGIEKNSEDFCLYAAAVQHRMYSLSNVESLPQKPTLERRMLMLSQFFQTMALAHISESYASQSLDKITIDSYKNKIVWLQSFLTQKNGVEIEAVLRNALLKSHPESDLARRSGAYVEAQAGTPLFRATQEALKNRLHGEAILLQKESDKADDVEAKAKFAYIIAILEQPGGLELQARIEVAKLARFYAELRQEVKKHNKDIRYRQMHQIID